ncbi:sister chromatid cohesion 1 protein 1 [Quercus suber]|uniref:Sister chromatid cohesion 1 protein 1 n=1 Tax=Quercus suber TaxID=58331 RepID=A0AAW0LAT2_QUESU
MAATMHAKINRRKLDKLNIIKICEEILNPSVPMALRLSGILMETVISNSVCALLCFTDDVTRLLVEINEAWKVKAPPDPTVLPKGKSHAKKEAVTLPENKETDFGDIEQSLNFSNTTATMGFQQNTYFALRLDSVDEPYINDNAKEEDPNQNFHQANADNITLFERFDSYQANADLYNRFERPSAADEFQYEQPDHQVNQPSHECKGARQDQERLVPVKRKARRPPASAMDYEQTMIPGHIYQSWLQNASDIVSRRGRKRKHADIMSTMKIVNLMELPPVVLIGDLFINGDRAVYYPPPLLELWMKSIQPPHDSASERTSPPMPPEPSSSSAPERVHFQDPKGFPFEDFHSGVGSESLGAPIEKQRRNIVNNDIPTEILMDELRANLMNNGVRVGEANLMVTPGNSESNVSKDTPPIFLPHVNSGDEVRSIPSSASGHGGLSHNSEVNSGRQMKAHFDTPGAPQVESLNNLATGMNRKGAALLFYQTCVLASRDILRVEQTVPYGDILISRGAKM